MTGRRALIAALACALLATACNRGATPMVAPTDQGSQAQVAVDAKPSAPPIDGPGELVGRPGGEPTSTPSATSTPTEEPTREGRMRPDLTGITDLSSVVRVLDRPEGGFDEGTVIIDETFDSTTPAFEAFESSSGSGTLGHFEDLNFYELVLAEPQGHLASPMARLDRARSEAVYIQTDAFTTSFAGLASVDRGIYCWASNGNDPLAGARYELLFGTEGEVRVVRYDQDGRPAALLLDEVWDAAAASAEDPEVIADDPTRLVRIGLLCRPDDEGRAQIAVRVERSYWVTTDQGNHSPGGGVGIVVAGRGQASPDTITTFSYVVVLDGAQVPLA